MLFLISARFFIAVFSNFNRKFVDVKTPDKLASDSIANLAAARTYTIHNDVHAAHFTFLYIWRRDAGAVASLDAIHRMKQKAKLILKTDIMTR